MKPLHLQLVFLFALTVSMGCSSLMRPKGTDAEIVAEVSIPDTVGEATRPRGLGMATIESVGLATRLRGTGADPRPSGPRQMLLDEMRKRNVNKPNQLLASPNTSMVLVRAQLPPGVRKGDRIDVEVRVPSRSQTTSLAGGWLMETKLREVAVLDQSLRTGHVRGAVEGDILIDSYSGNGDAVGELRGIVLGGGVSTKSRPIGLTLRNEHHSASLSKLISEAVNRRFDVYIRGQRQGVATPKDDRFIDLEIHPRYRNNLIRFLRVVEQIPLRETQLGQIDRIRRLESDLMVPATSALAALRLEAIGKEGTATLIKGLSSDSAEVRFYSAEALAYLDSDEAATTLGDSTTISAFRSRAMTALGAMSSVEAHDRLNQLLNAKSAETRYGAFRALQQMNPRDPILGHELLGSHISYHVVASSADPMVHVSRTERPEIVVFGNNQRLTTPLMILVGKSIVIKDNGRNQLRVTRYEPGKEDLSQSCSATVDGLIRTLVDIKASYPDIVTVLQEAKAQGAMGGRIVFDAVAVGARQYERGTGNAPTSASETP